MTIEIVNADCVDVLPDYAGQVDLIVTSPPYDAMREYAGKSDFEFAVVAPLIVDALRPGGVLCWNVGDQQRDGDYSLTSFRQAIEYQDLGLKCRERLIYERAHRQTRGHECYARNTEFVFVMTKGTDITFNPIRDVVNVTQGHKRYRDGTGRSGDKNWNDSKSGTRVVTREFGIRGEIWRYTTGLHHTAPDMLAAHKLHPAMMPIKLAQDLIRSYSDEGDLVLDPFVGSGTTARAAKRLGRDCVGIDINSDYCELARVRSSQEVLE